VAFFAADAFFAVAAFLAGAFFADALAGDAFEAVAFEAVALEAVALEAAAFLTGAFFVGALVAADRLAGAAFLAVRLVAPRLLSASLSVELGAKRITVAALIFTSSPVWGLRPFRAARRLVEKAPKPGHRTVPPLLVSEVSVSKKAWRTVSACLRSTPAPLATVSTSSDLFKGLLLVLDAAGSPSSCNYNPTARIGQAFPLPDKGFRVVTTRRPLWCKAFGMLEDGTYEALVVDASTVDDDPAGTMHVELAISSGPHKGEVVPLRGRFPGHSDIDLLAAPATLTVTDGRPSVTLDR
jgi:hypothetical protein